MNTYCLLFLLLFSFFAIGQGPNVETSNEDHTVMNALVASGGEARGNQGSVSYSIGQVFYTYIEKSLNVVAHGVQQHENSEMTPENPAVKITVYPNPTAEFVTISTEGLEDEITQYELFDLNGRRLKNKRLENGTAEINLSNLNSAVYLLMININNKGSYSFKILKN